MNHCWVVAVVALSHLLIACNAQKRMSKPNIIFIIGDDIGWNDLSYHGSDQISTPNLDALAYHGLIMHRHYSQQSCTPSRAAFLTGQYPIRVGFQGYPLSAGMPKFIPKDVNTLPMSLKKLGYSNHLVGKWHLGYAKKEYTPMGYGYDSHFGYWNGYIGYFNHANGYSVNGTDLHNDYEPITDKVGQYATDLFTKRAVEIITNHPEQDPLYLVLSHLAGHTGKTVNEDHAVMEVRNDTANEEKYYYIDNSIRRKYAEIIEDMDASVGEVIEALDKRDMLSNSIIVYFSDNGAPTYGMHSNAGSNYPLRGIKMTMYEGAVRTPAIIYSPLIKRKDQVFNSLFHISDWVPTIYKAAGGNVNHLGTIDGINHWDSMIGNQKDNQRQEMLIDVDPHFNYSAYIGYSGKYKYVTHSDQMNGYSGDKGFTNPVSHYIQVRSSKTHQYLKKTSNRRITLQKTIELRNRTAIHCNQKLLNMSEPNDTCKDFCLFDLENDPCEYNNIAAQKPEIAEFLRRKLEDIIKEAKPKDNYYIDEKADPKYCNHTWFNWLEEDDGCWYKSHPQTSITMLLK